MPFSTEYWAHRIFDVIANMDALRGTCVDDNVRSVRMHPGLLFGDPSAQEHLGHEQAPGSPHSTASVSTVSEAAMLDLEEDSGPPRPREHARNFDETWAGLLHYVEHCCVAASQPAAHYMAELYALHESLRLPLPPADHSASTAPSADATSFSQLRQDVLHWRKAPPAPACEGPVAPLRHPCLTSSCPVLDTMYEWLQAGCCNSPTGQLNARQALFLVVFALRLQVAQLHLPLETFYFFHGRYR